MEAKVKHILAFVKSINAEERRIRFTISSDKTTTTNILACITGTTTVDFTLISIQNTIITCGSTARSTVANTRLTVISICAAISCCFTRRTSTATIGRCFISILCLICARI